MITTDAGQSWSVLLDSTVLSNMLGDSLSIEEIACVAPASALLRVINKESSPRQTSVIAIYDGGDKLQKTMQPSFAELSLRLSQSNDWISSNARSTDSGMTWIPFEKKCTYTYLRRISGKIGVALGPQGITEVSYDSGKTWQCHGENPFTGVVLTKTDDGRYMADGFDRILQSTNAGESWSMFDTCTMRVKSFSAKALYTAAANQVFRLDWKTHERTTVTFRDGDILSWITVLSDKTIWVGKADGGYYSMDSGKTYTPFWPFWDDYEPNTEYPFFPLSDSTIIARTNPDWLPARYVISKDTGYVWQVLGDYQPLTPATGEVWFAKNDTAVFVTKDNGRSFSKIDLDLNSVIVSTLYMYSSQVSPHRIFNDSNWILAPYYTIDAGTTWQHIPGWDTNMMFAPIDDRYAFGSAFEIGGLTKYSELWRLDLPKLTSSVKRTIVRQASLPAVVVQGEYPLPESHTFRSAVVYDLVGRIVQRIEIKPDDRSIPIPDDLYGHYQIAFGGEEAATVRILVIE